MKTQAAPHAALVYNPIKVDVEALRSLVEHEERAAGWGSTLWLETSEDDPGLNVAKKAVESGAAVVIAAGGDGTVRAVAQGMRDGDVPLALLPSGTGNLLARNLDLTLDDAAHSLHVAFTGDDRAIDLGIIEIRREREKASEHVFLVMAGLGLDAKMLANTDDDLKKKAGWLAYVRALSLTLRDKNELRFEYTLDRGARKSIRAHTIIVGNCGALPANIVLLPDAAVDDGEFDILLLRPEGFIGWVQIFGKVLWENGVLRRTKAGRALMSKDVSALRYVRAAEITVDLTRSEDIELDGDGFGQAIGFSTRVQPGGLIVKIPASRTEENRVRS